MSAYKADSAEKPVVIILATEFRLPEVLRHLESGKRVIVIPAPDAPE